MKNRNVAVDSIYLDTESDKFCDDGSVPRRHHKKPILNKQEAFGTYQLFQMQEAFAFISTSFVTRVSHIELWNVTIAFNSRS